MTEPYKDVKKSGAKGIATGLGKGAVGMVTKSGAGMFGLLAYPASGIAKSLRSVTHTRSRKAVEAARRFPELFELHRYELGRLMPHLDAELGLRTDDVKPFPEDRRSLAGHLSRFLLGYAERQSLVLHLGDLQWADEATARTIESLVQRLAEAPGRYRLLLRYTPVWSAQGAVCASRAADGMTRLDATQAFTENHPLDTVPAVVAGLVAEPWAHWHVWTPTGSVALRVTKKGRPLVHRERVEAGLHQRRREHDGEEDVAGRDRHPHAEDEARDRAHDEQHERRVAGEVHEIVRERAREPRDRERPDDEADAGEQSRELGERGGDAGEEIR